MRKSRFTEEQMVRILREADKAPVAEMAKKYGVREQTLYAWRKKYGQVEAADVRQLRGLSQPWGSGLHVFPILSTNGAAQGQIYIVSSKPRRLGVTAWGSGLHIFCNECGPYSIHDLRQFDKNLIEKNMQQVGPWGSGLHIFPILSTNGAAQGQIYIVSSKPRLVRNSPIRSHQRPQGRGVPERSRPGRLGSGLQIFRKECRPDAAQNQPH